MKINWGLVILLISNAIFWFSVFTNGFFISLIWTIILAAVVGIGFKLYENRY